jgi:hypothetical protein
MMANNRSPLLRVAGWSAYASGVVAISGLLPILTIFAFGVSIPKLNDSAVIVQYVLALPITLALYPLARPRAPVLSTIALLSGIIGICAVVVIQVVWLFVAVLNWTTYLILIGTAMLLIGSWAVITGAALRRSTGPLRRSLLMGVLAAAYFAYPIWAIWLGRLLLSGTLSVPGPAIVGEAAQV